MQNYFNYFTEIETRFQARRGSILLLSTLDWALIETWRDAGVPLEAVLRGIDAAFDKYDERAGKSKGRLRKVNGLAWCAQSVMDAAEQMVEAATGIASVAAPAAANEERQSGFEQERIAAYLVANAEVLDTALSTSAAGETLQGIAQKLRALAAELRAGATLKTEEIETALTALEGRMFAALTLSASDEESITLREQATRELAPYRGRMNSAQTRQVTEQFLHKRLLEARGLPRLSLFYMSLG